MKRSWWISHSRFTCQVDTVDGRVVDTCPYLWRWRGKLLEDCLRPDIVAIPLETT